MLITRFQGSGVHNLLDFDIEFNKSLTFLTGINGSGKTTVLNLIEALLMPRLDHLVLIKFDQIRVTIEETGEQVELQATNQDNHTEITCSKFLDEKFTIDNKLVSDFLVFEFKPDSQGNGIEQQFQSYVLRHLSDNKVFQFINSLPTPAKLGLDRRIFTTNLFSESVRGNKFEHRNRNILEYRLEDGITEAIDLAKDSFTRCYRRSHEFDILLRQNLMTVLLDLPKDVDSIENTTTNDEAKFKHIVGIRDRLNNISEIINNFDNQIKLELKPIVDLISRYDFLLNLNDEEITEKISSNNNMFGKINKNNITLIEKISNYIYEYNYNIMKIFNNLNGFLNVVNNFLVNSNKFILFEERGVLKYRIKDYFYDEKQSFPNSNQDSQYIPPFPSNDEEGNKPQKSHSTDFPQNLPLSSLSSGEIQLVIIFAHLYFNPDTEDANIIMIDEPELSLHMIWQEEFVKALLEASKKTQLILATQSPAIILERVDECVEV